MFLQKLISIHILKKMCIEILMDSKEFDEMEIPWRRN
jgi:hypothetical protein